MDFINWTAVIVTAFVPLVAGFVYYHPKVLGTAWMQSLGKTEEDFDNSKMGLTFGISFVLAIVLSWFLKVLIETSHGVMYGGESFHTFQHGALHGAMFLAFFCIPVFVTNGMFEQKSAKNYWINIGYWVIVGGIMGGILDAWV